MKYFILLTLSFLSFTTLKAQKREIKKTFTEINTSIENGALEGVLEYFNPANKSFKDKSKISFENVLKLDSLSYKLELNQITVIKDTAIAIVFETKSYYKNELNITEVGWQTFTFIKLNNAWYINNIAERSYLQAEFVSLDMVFEPTQRNMIGTAEIELKVVEGGENNLLFWLNRGLTIHSITDDKGKDLPFERNNLAVLIPWATTFSGVEQIKLKIKYSGNFFNEFEQSGYSLVNIGEEGCFANFVTQWYPKINGTLTKAELNYTVPKDLIVASVGKLIEKEEKDDVVTYSYLINTPMDYTFNANKFFHYSDFIDGVQVNVFFLSGTEKKAKLYAENAMKLISFLKDLYGIFPYDSYSISEVPPKITKGLGGSGGQGLNFYPTENLRDDVFEFPLIAHEVGHMWWGSWVMSNKASGAMIDEGFSQLNAVLCYRHFYGEKAMWDFLRDGTGMYPQSAKEYFARFGTGTNDMPIGVYDENKSRDFNSLAYVKSHFVYAMLMETVGYDVFMKGIRRILSEYGNRQFDLLNLQEIMEQESETSLDYFFEQWVYRSGAPEFEFTYSVVQLDDDRYEMSGNVKQLQELYQVTAEIELAGKDHRDIYKLDIAEKETKFSYITNYNPSVALFDPDYKILRWTEDFKHLHLLRTGMVQAFTNKNEDAVKTLSEFIDHSPHNVNGHTFLGVAYLNLKDYEKAKEHLQFVIDEFETTNDFGFAVAFSFMKMGQLYETIGESDKAIPYFTQVLTLPNVEGSRAKARAFFNKIKGNKND